MKYQVTSYQLLTPLGRPIRKATQVTLPSGKTIRFLERLPVKLAIQQALATAEGRG